MAKLGKPYEGLSPEEVKRIHDEGITTPSSALDLLIMIGIMSSFVVLFGALFGAFGHQVSSLAQNKAMVKTFACALPFAFVTFLRWRASKTRAWRIYRARNSDSASKNGKKPGDDYAI